MKIDKNARKWWKKWSTWLSGLAGSMIVGAGSIAVLGTAPFIPPIILYTIALVAVVLVPVATSLSQWPEDEPSDSDPV